MHAVTELSSVTRCAESLTCATSQLQNLKSKPKFTTGPEKNQTFDIRPCSTTLSLSKSIMGFFSAPHIIQAQLIQR